MILVGVLACNKIETKKFHDNECESIGPGQDTIVIEQTKYYITAKINTETEVQLRLHGAVNLDADSIQSAWVQIKSSTECYQAKSFKTRTDQGGPYFVIDYVVPTFIQVGYPATWKVLYKGVAYYPKTTLTEF
jgi:hypothetical protein